MITLDAEQVRVDGSPPDFGSVRFYDGLDMAKPIPFWKTEERLGIWATFWVRVPELPVGPSFITYSSDQPGGLSYRAETLTARLRAIDGLRLALQTDPPGKATTHPTVVVAEGWMTRRSPEDPPTIDRVLVDTMFPQNPYPFASANELENPALWLSSDRGMTWDWPPGVTMNPAWQHGNNWIVGKPPSGGNNSDPEAIFLRAGSLPGGGPSTDTLRVYHRTNTVGHAVVFDDLTSVDGSWSGVRISAFNATSLNGPYRSFTSPTVIQKADGSLRMWASNMPEGNTIVMVMYESQDGVNWTTVGNVDLRLPRGLWGPWHFDVIEEDGVYWMAGSFGALLETGTNMRDLYLLRSADGLKFDLLLPAVLEPPPLAWPVNGWYAPGCYRPSILYVRGEGLEFYVGCNDRNTSTLGDGGTGRWSDPGWVPNQPRPVSAISTVFWGSARDFVDDPADWPHPWYLINNANSATALIPSSTCLGIIASSPSIPRAMVDSVFVRPRDHEYHMRVKIEPTCYAPLQAAGTYGPWLDSRNNGNPPTGGIQFRWGSSSFPAAGPAPLGDVGAFHNLRFRRLGSSARCWWNDLELSPSPFAVPGKDLADELAWEVVRASSSPAALYVEWYFYREAAEPEPVVVMGCDDHDPCTIDRYDPGVGCVHVANTCDDRDACTIDSCNPQLGCVHAAIACDDGDSSTIDFCAPETGRCYHSAAPNLAGAISVKTHGPAGDFAIDLSTNCSTESRSGGPTKLIVTFDREVQTVNGLEASNISLSSGQVHSLLIAGNTLTVQLGGVADGTNLTVGFPGIVNAVGGTPVLQQLRIKVLQGDVSGDGNVSLSDMLMVRDWLNRTVTADVLRGDVTADGVIDLADMLAVRDNLNRTVPNSRP